MTSRFSGREIEGDPELERAKQAFETETYAAIDTIAAEGIPIQNAPIQVPGYRQQDPSTCFYASLLAVRKTLPYGASAPETELPIAKEARELGLLSIYGAETSRDRWVEQKNLVRDHFGLDINFFRERTFGLGNAFVNAIQNGNHVVIGMPRHWVVIDGLRKMTLGSKWTGMDPALGSRISYPSDLIKERLVAHGLPLVIVEGLTKPMFRPTPIEKSEKFKPAKPRLQPAKPRFQQR